MPVPKYAIIEDYIENMVKEGKLKPGDKVFSESKISEKFSVTEMTARHALESLKNKGVVCRIHGKGTFVTGGDSFGSGKGNLWFVLPEKLAGIEPNPYYSPVLWGAEKAAKKSGYRLVIMSVDEHKKIFAEKVDANRVKGVILSGFYASGGIKGFLSRNIPVVMVDCLDNSGVCDSVYPDNFSGVRTALEYLVSRGHKKIAHIAGNIKHTNGDERVRAYLKFSSDNGFRGSESLILKGDFLFAAAKKAVETNFKKIRKCSAVFAANDLSALGAVSALKKRGVKIPEDVSIMGFDDIDSSKYSSPELTTIRVDKCSMGEAAVGYLEERINGISFGQRIKRVRTGLVIRNSVLNLKEG
ncbi:MAG: GntR family transcriptional regulator [bacterium]|nr:GntR family transcriptional regulator [bacterium]